jgi:putative endonuclease
MLMLRSQRLRLLEEFVASSRVLARRLRKAQRKPEHLEVGQRGEEAAYFHLRRLDYVIVARGWRNAKLRGDIDLIGWQNGTLCFIEVKTRTSRNVATAESAVDEEKCSMLRRMARQYIRALPSAPAQTRFDILSIYFDEGSSPKFELFQGAFDWY